MKPPPGVSHDFRYVCKLRKTLYGLKQAALAWFEKFSAVISSLGFAASSYDSALLVKYTNTGRIILFLYVDDMIITSDDVDGISVLKEELVKQFEMKDLGPLRYFFGIEVTYSSRGYLLSYSKYVVDILERARLTDNKTLDTPIEVNSKYSSSNGVPLLDPTLYRTIVGSLVYLTITCPDIAYIVYVVSQLVGSPITVHWAAVLRISWYLQGTVFQSLLLSSSSYLELCAYFDADYSSDPTDHKSVTDFYIFLGDYLISWKSRKQPIVSLCDYLISWKSRKQPIVSLSSIETEYRALTSFYCQLFPSWRMTLFE